MRSTRRRIAGRRGFTMVELLVTLTITSVILGAATSVIVSVQRSVVRQREIARAENALRIAQTTISTVLRTAGANPLAIASGSLPRIEPNPLASGTFDNVRIVADFNPPDGDVADDLEDVSMWISADTLFTRWTAGQTAAPIAHPVTSILFQYFRRDGTAIVNASDIAQATSVKVTVGVQRRTRPSVNVSREFQVYLRNRT